MRQRVCLTVLVALAILTLLAPRAFSQATTAFAQLNGVVRDQSGGVVVNATISLRDVDTNHVYTVSSSDVGYYTFTNLPPANYELTAQFTGFAKYTHTGIALLVGQVATIDITLRVAGGGESVTVSTEAPVIEPTRTEISQVVDTEQIKSLPISGRLFTDFALLSPGVAIGHTSAQSPFTDPNVTRISFGGQRDLNNAVTVDGADNIDTANGSQRATPSQEAVSEFRVVNNSFGAEYGRALGGIVNIVTKSGTNELHGSIYDYLENNAFNAKTILSVPGTPSNTLRQNQFGATLGGPIRHDKTFFFLNYEGQRRAQSPTFPGLLLAPVDAAVAPLFPAGFTNLQAINAVKQSFGIPTENLNVLRTNDVNNGFVKIDHQLNNTNRISARYSIQNATALNLLVGETLDGGGIGAPSAGRDGLTGDQALVGTWNSQFTPALVNSVLAQWARRNYGFAGVTGQPNLDVPNLLSFGHNFGAFDRYNETRVQFSDTLSWVKGKHFAKFGFDTNYIRNFVIWPGFTPSRDIFASLDDLLVSGPANWGTTPCPFPLNATLPSPPFPPNTPALHSPCIVAFFWGAPIGSGPFNASQASPPVGTTWQNAFRPDQAQNFFFHLNHSYWGFFAQDQWRITPKLTLNYGLRYDFETGVDFFVNPYRKAVAPRVGLAYSPDSKTVIRAGYGIFFDRYTLTFFFVSGPQRPPMIPGLPTSNNMQTGTWLLNSAFLGNCPPAAAMIPACPPGAVPFDVINAMFENFITGSGLTNTQFPAVTNSQFPNNQPYFQGGSVVDKNQRNPYSEQSSLEIDREIGKGLSVSAGYLFVAAHHLNRPIDLNIAPHTGTFPGTTKDTYNFALPVPSIPAPPGGQNGTAGIFYYTDASGNSAYHGLTLQATERAGKYFRLSANYTFSKAIDDGKFLVFVDTPQSNDQRNLERAISNQDIRHRFIANFVASAPDKPVVRNFELSSIVTLQSPRPFTMFVGFDANTDGNPVNDRVGESARDTYLGDGLRSVDVRLSRLFHLGERYRVQLSADVFNAFNRANVDEVFTVYGAPFFIGSVPRHYKDGIIDPANPTFGTPRTVLNPRQFQFAAKFTF
jgi:outer membrane receptor protein involved in Fe transport